jgi:2-dehydro-3-deoxy-D-arabinonate dehydratase
MMIVYRSREYGVVIREKDRWLKTPKFSFDELFRSATPEQLVAAAVRDGQELGRGLEMDSVVLAPPMESQEVWAAGVTYFRSRDARMEESEWSGGDIFYDRVYEAERPELFIKGGASRTVGHGEKISIRSDSNWDVPEPELTVAVSASGRVFGFTVGNDVSSREIEGENLLYLPQAKVWRNSCALGPGLLIGESMPVETAIRLRIERGGVNVFEGETGLAQMKRTVEELVGWLMRDNVFPEGCYLMTGTGVVPDADFTLQSGDLVEITIEGIGTLINEVE